MYKLVNQIRGNNFSKVRTEYIIGKRASEIM